MPKLAQEMETDFMRNKACLADMVRLAQKFGKHQAYMGHTKLTNPTQSPSKWDASPRMIHVDRPCPIPGHVGQHA